MNHGQNTKANWSPHMASIYNPLLLVSMAMCHYYPQCFIILIHGDVWTHDSYIPIERPNLMNAISNTSLQCVTLDLAFVKQN